MSFGEEPLAAPVVVSHTSDKCHPTRLDIRGDEQIVRIEFTKGEGTGPAYLKRFDDNVTVRNLPDDAEGDPQPQEWDDFVAGTEIATYLRAQPSALSNGEVLKRLAVFILQQKGII